MSQIEFQNMLEKYLDQELSKNERATFEKMLRENSEWAAEFHTAERLKNMANQWRDIEVPNWNRMPHSLKPPSLWRTWLNWLPLAMGTALMLAVLFNVQVSRTTDGFTFTFGNAGIKQEQLDAIEAKFNDQVKLIKKEHSQQLTYALNDFAAEQDASIEQAILDYDNQSRTLRRSEYNELLAGWRKQRDLDLQVISNRYHDLYDASLETRNGLITLAQYVKK